MSEGTDIDKGKKSSNKRITLYAVTDGEIIPMEEVEDEVFAQKMIGDGFAMNPTSFTVISPIDGKLIEVADAKHAYYIEVENDVKVLIHVGIDTLLLNGEGFSTNVGKNMQVSRGDELVTFDEDLFKEKGYKMTVSVIVLDNEFRDIELILHPNNHAKVNQTKAMTINF